MKGKITIIGFQIIRFFLMRLKLQDPWQAAIGIVFPPGIFLISLKNVIEFPEG